MFLLTRLNHTATTTTVLEQSRGGVCASEAPEVGTEERGEIWVGQESGWWKLHPARPSPLGSPAAMEAPPGTTVSEKRRGAGASPATELGTVREGRKSGDPGEREREAARGIANPTHDLNRPGTLRYKRGTRDAKGRDDVLEDDRLRKWAISEKQCVKCTSSPYVYAIWSLYCASGGSDWAGALVASDGPLHTIHPPVRQPTKIWASRPALSTAEQKIKSKSITLLGNLICSPEKGYFSLWKARTLLHTE